MSARAKESPRQGSSARGKGAPREGSKEAASRTNFFAATALVTALLALAISVWAAISASRTHEEIRHLGDLLSAGTSPHQMSLDHPPPPQLDDPD